MECNVSQHPGDLDGLNPAFRGVAFMPLQHSLFQEVPKNFCADMTERQHLCRLVAVRMRELAREDAGASSPAWHTSLPEHGGAGTFDADVERCLSEFEQ